MTGCHGCCGTECDGSETCGGLNTVIQLVSLWMSVIFTEENTIVSIL